MKHNGPLLESMKHNNYYIQLSYYEKVLETVAGKKVETGNHNIMYMYM